LPFNIPKNIIYIKYLYISLNNYSTSRPNNLSNIISFIVLPLAINIQSIQIIIYYKEK
jgi:hypothetical protein